MRESPTIRGLECLACFNGHAMRRNERPRNHRIIMGLNGGSISIEAIRQSLQSPTDAREVTFRRRGRISWNGLSSELSRAALFLRRSNSTNDMPESDPVAGPIDLAGGESHIDTAGKVQGRLVLDRHACALRTRQPPLRKLGTRRRSIMVERRP